MICDDCKKNEAVISYAQLVNNELVEVHLCADCARKRMMGDFTFNSAVNDRVGNFLKELFKLTGSFQDEMSQKICPNCGTKFSEISEHGLGCEKCYEHFEDELKSAFRYMSENTRHVGKIPKSAGKEVFYNRDYNILKEKLARAIELEEYEEAAKLRDQMRDIKKEEYEHRTIK